jgi:hypothetical protein
MRIVFLDIDGVLNHFGTNWEDARWSPQPDGLLRVPIASECVMRLNRLTDETRARIVISSSWRRFARWQDLGPALARHGVTGEIVGETPDLVNDAAWRKMWRTRPRAPIEHERIQRGMEIGEWLLGHPEVVSFAILDDGSDMVCLRSHLVQTDPNVGLDDPDVERAIHLLVGDLAGDSSVLDAWGAARRGDEP